MLSGVPSLGLSVCGKSGRGEHDLKDYLRSELEVGGKEKGGAQGKRHRCVVHGPLKRHGGTTSREGPSLSSKIFNRNPSSCKTGRIRFTSTNNSQGETGGRGGLQKPPSGGLNLRGERTHAHETGKGS